MSTYVTITVNDKKISVPEGTLLIDACEQYGFYIPRFCYLKELSPSGNCRMCLVKIEKRPKLEPACMTPVTKDMVVWTNAPEVIETRKAILEFMLINHPLDCPICDKAGECMLQDQYMVYSGEKSHFNEEKVAKEKLFIFSDRIIYDAERCITCSRCVRFTHEISKSRKLGIIKRADLSYVALAPNDVFDDPYSYCVTDICPVGALTSRRFRFKERVWNLNDTESICAGCSRGCNIRIQHKDNEIYRILPRENSQVNQRWMCDFGRDFYLDSSGEHTRLTGAQIDQKPVEYKDFVGAVAGSLKESAAKTAVVLSSHATNEELLLARQLIDHLGIKQVYHKSDREWEEGREEVESDDLLITADKTPNLTGIKKIFPKAQPASAFAEKSLETVFVWGANFPADKIKKTNILALSTVIDAISSKAKWALAGRTPAEKYGSFTNCDGIVQTFRRALKGDDNFEDLAFFVDLLKALEVEPIGRTVAEVQKNSAS
ncbi:(2Fe-2S)-binding protein [candidate division KSB1 bacterium]|nr:(2Fe-2S)-binding protein [candidate division KSB1 bacterium]